MVSLMNGLSAAGAAVSSFAGTAGLEQQKATLAQQGMVLADQLAHASKTQEIAQQGSIQAGITGQQTASAERIGKMDSLARVAAAQAEAGGMIGAAQKAADASRANNKDLIAAQKPEWDAQASMTAANAKLTGTQADENAQIWDLTHAISLEQAKGTAGDQALIASKTAQRSAIVMGDPLLMGKMQDATAASVRALQQELTGADAGVARLTAQLAGMDMSAPGAANAHAQQEAELKAQQAQRDGVLDRLDRATLMQQQYSPQSAPAPAPPPPAGKAPPATQFLPQGTPNAPAGAAPGPRPGLNNGATPAMTPIPQ